MTEKFSIGRLYASTICMDISVLSGSIRPSITVMFEFIFGLIEMELVRWFF